MSRSGSVAHAWHERASAVYRVARLTVAVGILAWVVGYFVRDWPETSRLLASFHVDWLAASLAVAAVSQLCLPVVWLVLLAGTGLLPRGALAGCIRTWFVSYFYRWVPGKVLVLTERLRLASKLGVPPGANTALIAVESVLSPISGLVVAAAALAAIVGPGLAWASIACLLGVVTVGVPAAFSRADRIPGLRRLFRGHPVPKLRRSTLALALTVFLLYWVLIGSAFYLLIRAFVDLSPAGFPAVVTTYAASATLGQVAVLAPSGVGVREGALAIGLAQILPVGPAAAIAVVSRLWLALVEFALLAAVLLATRTTAGMAGRADEEIEAVALRKKAQEDLAWRGGSDDRTHR